MTKTNKRDPGQAERAVYELVRNKSLNAGHTPLFRRELAFLVRAGLLTRDAEGVYHDAVTTPSGRPRSEPPPPPMLQVVIRIPPDMVAALDAMGPTRSEAVRRAIAASITAKPS